MTHVALITWIMTVCAGLYLLAIWLIEYNIGALGGAVSRLLRTVVSGHVLLASSGLVAWTGYLIADRDMLAAISPMTALDRLTAPVLLCHGDRDSNVPVLESIQAHQELTALGAPAELLLLKGEGHTVVGRENLLHLSERVAEWFDRWL